MQKIYTYYALGIVFVFFISQLFVSGHSGLVDKVYSISQISQSENEEIYKIQEIVAQNQNGNTSEDIELEGIVTKVIDGDTLDINGTRIRLALVDTPERGQGGFDKAKNFVESLCLGKKGELDVDNGQRRGDRYGREVGVVYCDGVNTNAKVMENKMAKILTEFCDISEFSKENWTASQCQ
ncbi:MAG: thermonuclease family protein [Nitrososphaeraceae archaeon]